MLGLQKIVLHNSYFKGKTVNIPCAGHTNSSGDNGAGKTSALNLIPVFYGKEPDRLIARAADKESFIDYYLPKPSSLIAFEYLREDGPCCAVLYRHTEGANKLIYRFVKGSFDTTFFREATRSKMALGVAVRDIFQALKTANIVVSKQLDVITDYRAVIQNDKRLLKKGGRNSAKFRRLAQEYCLGTAQSSMSHLDEMTAALLKRSEMFNKFKEMIAATMFNDIHIGEKPAYLSDRTIVENIASLREFAANETLIRQCVETYQERRSGLKAIAVTARTLMLRLEENISQQAQLRKKIVEIIDARDQARVAFETKNDVLSIKRSQLTADCKQNEISLNDIHERKLEWDSQDIVAKKEQYQNLATYRSQLEQTESEFKLLTEKVHSLEAELRAAINDREARKNSDVQRVFERKEAVRVKKDVAKDRHDLEQEKIRQADKRAQDDFDLDPVHQRHETLKHKKWKLNYAATKQELTDEESAELDKAARVIEAIEDDIEGAESKFQHAETVVSEAQKANDTAQSYLDEAMQRRQNAETTRDILRSQAYPEDNTLLANLRTQDPGWVEHIGRVIEPSLLMRKDLTPVYDETIESLYGWSIDLHKLDKPVHALSEEALKSKLEKAEMAAKNAADQVDEVIKGAKKFQLALKVANQTRNETLHSLKQRKQNKLEAASDLKQLKARIEKDREVRTADLLLKASAIEQELNILGLQITEKRKSIREGFAQQTQDEKGRFAVEEGDFAEQLKVLDTQLDVLEKEHEAALKNLERTFNERFSKEGIDPQKIRTAREDVEARKRTIQTITEYAQNIEQYDIWLRQEWIRAPELEKTLATDTAAFEATELAINNLKAQHEAARKELKAQQKQTSHSLENLKEASEKAEKALANVGKVPDGEASMQGSLTLLTEQLINLNIKEAELRAKVLEDVARITSLIMSFTESRIHNAWDLLLETHKQNSPQNEFSTEFKLEQPQDFLTLFEDKLPEIQELLIEDVRSVGKSIQDYYDTLKLLNSQVTRVTHELQRKLNTNQEISSLSDINVIITSRVESDDYWQPLVAFNEEWMRWLSEQERGLPSDSLIRSLKTANDTLLEARITQDVNSLIDMEIHMKENGRPTRIRSNRDFNDSSSNGLSFLAICIVFMGMSRYLCPDYRIQLTWPVDELASLSPSNVAKLFSMMKNENIAIFSAFPSADPNILRHFSNRLLLDHEHGIRILSDHRHDKPLQDDPMLQRLQAKTASIEVEENSINV